MVNQKFIFEIKKAHQLMGNAIFKINKIITYQG